MNPSVTIVIPAYDAERYLRQTLESASGQTYRDWELVVVDDGSTDSTREIVAQRAESDSRIRLVCQQNGRVARARNRGIAERSPSSRYIALLDHDDVWETDALATLVAAAERNPDAPAVHGIARMIDAEGRAPHEDLEAWCRDRRALRNGRETRLSLDEPTTFDSLVFRNTIMTPGQALIRVDALESAGPFDPDMVPGDDWDLWMRLSLIAPLGFVDRVLIGWRVHDQNGTHNRRSMEASAERVRAKLLARADLTPAQRVMANAAAMRAQRDECSSKLRFAWTDLMHLRPASAARQLGIGIKRYLHYRRSGAA